MRQQQSAHACVRRPMTHQLYWIDCCAAVDTLQETMARRPTRPIALLNSVEHDVDSDRDGQSSDGKSPAAAAAVAMSQ
eukprot:scaffold669972_cov45-Prasinocladus_malaysianus.AAC.1